MNILEYRAMKAQEEAQAQAQAKAPEQPAQPPAEPQTTPQQPQQTPPQEPQTTQTQQATTDSTANQPTKIVIDGVGEVSPDEIKEWKNGYLRQQDYTKKTQEVARQRDEVKDALQVYNAIKQNPQLAQVLAQQTPVPPTLDPATAKVVELENKLYDMMLEREIERLQNKYPDFEAREVLEVAHTRKLVNLEDAYHLAKSLKQPSTPQQQPQLNIDELKQQIRAELLKELESERNATRSIIATNDAPAPVRSNEPQLTEAEKRVAEKTGMSYEEYAKWRDIGKSGKRR